MYKTISFIKKLIAPCFLGAVGASFVLIPLFPGRYSNYIAWLETEGNSFSQSTGILLLALSLLLFIFAIRTTVKNTLVITKGTLSCLIEDGVITEIVEQLLSEYFNDPSLRAELTFENGQLFISAEVPEGATDKNAFVQFLTNRLFALVGYYGKINLTMVPKEVFQEPA
jgi:hypothetical protein